jgi:hypothetical protein
LLIVASEFIESLFNAKPEISKISDSSFPQLQRAASHYRFAPGVLLVRWLSGFSVQPPCAIGRSHELHLPVLSGLCVARGLTNDAGMKYNGKQCIVTKLIDTEKKASVRFLEDGKEFILKFEKLSPVSSVTNPDLQMPICERVVESGSKFCQAHKCSICEEHVKFESKFTYKYCVLHACSAQSCPEARLPVSQLYCRNHSCSGCLDEKPSSSAALHGHCRDHPLFDCAVHTCSNLAVSWSRLCKDHAEEDSTKCHATNSKGKPCKANALPALSFCKDHAYLRFYTILISFIVYLFCQILHCASTVGRRTHHLCMKNLKIKL